MKRIINLIICLIAVIAVNADNVPVELKFDKSKDGVLDFIPGFLCSNNNAIIYNTKFLKDGIIEIYDNKLQSSTINFGTSIFDKAFFVDKRVQAYDVRTQFCQTFFNDDDLLEAIICEKFVMDEYYTCYKNFKIINQNGEVLYVLENPDGCSVYSEGVKFIKVDDDTIIIQISYDANSMFNSSGKSPLCYYIIKTNQISSNIPIAYRSEVKLSENPINRGDTLLVSFSDDVAKGKLYVTSINGQIVKVIDIDSDKVEIPTYDMKEGMYIISCDSKAEYSAKIIIK